MREEKKIQEAQEKQVKEEKKRLQIEKKWNYKKRKDC